MRIIITETQYKSILKENKREKFIARFIDQNRTTPMEEVVNELFFNYGIGAEHIGRFDNLTKYFSDRLGVKLNLKTATGKIHFLHELINFVGYRFKSPIMGFIENTIQGLFDNVIDEVLEESGGDFRSAIKKLSVVMKMLPRRNNLNTEFFDMVKNRAEQEGYAVVRKPYEWTFEKGGGRIQSVIDYIKSTEKKTRGGWQRSVGKDPNEWKSWNSRMWGAMLDADIIQSHREGKDTVYTLGPNAEAFEQGKLIGF